ncbi:hypothetical protein AMATHDRAFT_73844 [Amanita thiersii Skay4041]|uniref:AMP-dependent synthetase/ligase domain-containing protein n=1 Tax=Amanita thiersii Skay4041 TaxID=703135 RepID=A0A2A9NWK3_9AGAR|nr:hypothetical protein AMATHDRAFT_73844 [Amanita thiersii Skay4041]
MSWTPKCSLAQAEAALCAPGTIHELETRLINGTLYRVYKNLWPSLRVFWLATSSLHADTEYLVFENQRLTFAQAFQRSVKAASIYRNVFGIQKGDRVAICSRNYPEYLVAFWACHLIGAVAVLANAWLPSEVLKHCFAHTQSKLIIVDAERADKLEHLAGTFAAEIETTAIVVLESQEGKGKWEGMDTWDSIFNGYSGETSTVISQDPKILPEDNATILFTSGTTGLPKGVLSTHRQFLTNVLNVLAGPARARLRRGEDLTPPPPDGPQKGVLLSVPFFHVTGLTSLSMLSTLSGLKVVIMRKWNPVEAGGVPSMVSDLTHVAKGGLPLDSLMFGGAPAPDLLISQARKAFPASNMSQGYGLTETNSVAVGFGGEDYIARPTSCGLPTPVNDVKVMNGDVEAPVGTVGEVWLRGPNVMKGYWADEGHVISRDGWLRSGDLGMLDEEGFLYIRDRIKDIIIRGGENIDSVSVENALYAHEGVLEAAVVGVPDKRLGELVTAVISVKPDYQGKMTEQTLISFVQTKLPRFAVPVMVIVQDEPLERTPSGKIVKGELRKLVRVVWEKRRGAGAGEAPAKL